MPDFVAVTACNQPKLKDHLAVERVLASYYLDPDMNVGMGFDQETGVPYLFLYGYTWPEAWKLPPGVKPEEFCPYEAELYEDGADGFVELLKELATFLAEPLTVQGVGFTKCCFPLSACEWHVEPNGTEVQLSEFGHCQPTAAGQ
jgi:hypothetical protein